MAEAGQWLFLSFVMRMPLAVSYGVAYEVVFYEMMGLKMCANENCKELCNVSNQKKGFGLTSFHQNVSFIRRLAILIAFFSDY